MKDYSKVEMNRIFTKEYNGYRNFITPLVQNFIQNGKLIAEISTGDGIVSRWIVGVTVLEVAPDDSVTRRPDISRCFQGDDKVKDLMDEAEKWFMEV